MTTIETTYRNMETTFSQSGLDPTLWAGLESYDGDIGAARWNFRIYHDGDGTRKEVLHCDLETLIRYALLGQAICREDEGKAEAMRQAGYKLQIIESQCQFCNNWEPAEGCKVHDDLQPVENCVEQVKA